MPGVHSLHSTAQNQSSALQCWTSIFLIPFGYLLARISIFLILVGYGNLTVILFSIPFGYVHHARFFIPRENRPSINVVENGIDPYDN